MQKGINDEIFQAERRILLLPPTQRDAEAICKLLQREGIRCDVCASMRELCSALSEFAGAVIVSEESLQSEYGPLSKALENQPVWSDLPLVVLSRSGIESVNLAALVSSLGNVSLLERPVRMSTLVSVVRVALRARERQYQIRDQFEAREAAEAALNDSREQLERVVKSANVGVWFCPLPFDEMIWDDTVRSHFHLSPDVPVTIQMFFDGLHPDDRERVRTAIEASIENRTPYDIDYRTVSADCKSVKWIRASGGAMYDSAGTPIRFNGITLDITDRKVIEEERTRLLDAERIARSEAERAGQMKDEFLATLSHELRTPLSAILGWAQILALPSANADDLAEGVKIIERNARAQAQIIEDLLDMSRIISGKVRLDVQRLDLNGVIQSAVDTVQPAAIAKEIQIRSMLDSTSTSISGDANRLQQVFWNLLSNAVKFTPKGGQVRVILQRSHSALEVSVIDNGEGIDPSFLPQVFDRFRQANASMSRVHGGLGLGLAIVKQLVELHGGTIEARSAGLGHGSTFVVSVPMTAVASVPSVKQDRRSQSSLATQTVLEMPALMTGMKVLIVDDEPDARALLKRLLEDCNVDVLVAQSASEAIEFVKSKQPQLLISDIGMPGEDGYSLIRRVRALSAAQGGSIPAVALTAYARAEDRINAIKAGFQHHLAKPVEPAELLAILASLSPKVTQIKPI